MALFEQNSWIRAKFVLFGEGGCIRVKEDVFGQKLLYSGKSGSTRALMVVFGQTGCIRVKWLHSGKVVVFYQGHCIRAKWLYSVKSVCIRAKWL